MTKLVPIESCNRFNCHFFDSFDEEDNYNASCLFYCVDDQYKLGEEFGIYLQGFCHHSHSRHNKESIENIPVLPDNLNLTERVRQYWDNCAPISDEDLKSDFPAWCPLQDYDDGEE